MHGSQHLSLVKNNRFIMEVLLVSLLITFFILVRLFYFDPHISGDTVVLVQNAHAAIDAVSKGHLFATGIVHFPLFQYLIAAIGIKVGLNDTSLLNGLIWVNTISFIGICVILFSFARNRVAVYAGFVPLVVFFSSYSIWYSVASFNEMSAALVTLIFTVCCIQRRSLFQIGLFSFLSGLTKEIAPFLLMIIGWVALYRFSWRDLISSRRYALALVCGCLGSILINCLFNVFRFGVIYNVTNMDKALHVPKLDIWWSFFRAIMGAPGGGLLFFYTTGTILSLSVLTIFVFRSGIKKPSLRTQKRAIPGCGMMILMVGLIGGLAKWYAPLGWVAYGPRLCLPYLPALLLLTLHFYKIEMILLLRYLCESIWRLIAVASLISAVGISNFLVVIKPESFRRFFTPTMKHPQLASVRDGMYYYSAVNEALWEKFPTFYAYDYIFDPNLRYLNVIYVALIFSVFLFQKRYAVKTPVIN